MLEALKREKVEMPQRFNDLTIQRLDSSPADVWCERTILGLVLGILVFSPLATGAVRPQDFVIVQWLVLGVLAVWAVRLCISPRRSLTWPPMCWAVVAFLAYALGRYATAEIEYLARQEVIKVFVYGCLFLAILNNLRRAENVQIIVATLILLGMGIGLYALVQFLTDSNSVWHFLRPDNYRKRGSGTFICPNNLAGYLEMLFPLALAYTIYRTNPTEETGKSQVAVQRFDGSTIQRLVRRRGGGYLRKIFVGYACLAIFVGIIVSVSRGGWLATGVAISFLLLWLALKAGYRLQALGILAVLGITTAVFLTRADLSFNRHNQMKFESQTADLRIRIWKSAWKMWQDHLVWGVGPAHFDYRYRQYRQADTQTQNRPDRVHNDYLNTLVDWGIVGGVIVASAWALFFSGVIRNWRSLERLNPAFLLGASVGLAAVLVHSFFDFNMHIPANAILALTLVALLAGHFNSSTLQPFNSSTLLRIGVILLLLGAIGALGYQTWRGTREQRWLTAAENHPHYSTARLAAWEQAFAVEPKNFETAYNIGETLRLQSWHGAEGYEHLTAQAMEWFAKASALNPRDPYSPMRYGMCLHWLRRHDEAAPYFHRAIQLDPNSYYVTAHMGWHHIQLREWDRAKFWMEESFRLLWDGNNIARTYYPI
ncbi:MAG: O-antigen ligase family protein, partial [Verrucomicrobia subdivision 3 bacterium]|nr:O-antigen ligase family protein [Limisphaerales bacterium]